MSNFKFNSERTITFLLDDSRIIGAPVNALVRHKASTSTEMVPVNQDLVRTYVINYLKSGFYFLELRKKHAHETSELANLELSLRQHGGSLNPEEQQRLRQFEQGRGTNRNLGVYTAYLDYLRLIGETFIRHGLPGKRK